MFQGHVFGTGIPKTSSDFDSGNAQVKTSSKKKSKVAGFSIDSILQRSDKEVGKKMSTEIESESSSDSVISESRDQDSSGSRDDSAGHTGPHESCQINQKSSSPSNPSNPSFLANTKALDANSRIPAEFPIEPFQLPIHPPRTLLPNPATGLVQNPMYNPLLRDNPLFSSVAEGIAMRQRFIQNQIFQRNFDFSRIFGGIYPQVPPVPKLGD